ncbi:MAG: hypothetical protein ACRDL6_06545 [Solirubrobacterales bacterium]
MKRLLETETLLALACAGGAAMLAASQFTDIFQLTPPGGEALEAVEAGDQHGYATLVLAAFALVMLVIAIALPRPEGDPNGVSLVQIASLAIAICGGAALLLFLIIDLPDVNKVGTVDDPRESFIDAEAKPQAGFWLELVGSLVLAACGAALATIRRETDQAQRSPDPDKAARTERVKDAA